MIIRVKASILEILDELGVPPTEVPRQGFVVKTSPAPLPRLEGGGILAFLDTLKDVEAQMAKTSAREKIKAHVERAVLDAFADRQVFDSEVRLYAHEYLRALVRECIHDYLTKKFGSSLTGPFAPDKRYMSYEFNDYVRKQLDVRLEKDPLPIQKLIDEAVRDTVLNREDRLKIVALAARQASEAKLRDRVRAQVDVKATALAEQLADQLLAEASKAILEDLLPSVVEASDVTSET